MNKNKGITLIALIITIVILIILAGVIISLLIGKNGILNKAEEARRKNNMAKIQEELNRLKESNFKKEFDSF